MAPAIALENVHKRYRHYKERYRSLKEIAVHRRLGVWEDRWVLQDVSLDVQPGTTLGLVGPNGAGKSTALKLMARILTPDRGRVQVSGRLSALIELGAGFQPEYTGRENIYLNASLLGLTRSEIERKFDQIVAFSELEDYIDAPLRTYSSGMYMRLGFSVAIHVDPEILLVDEILAVGDASFQRKCTEWLETFQRRGGTIVLVTHDVGAIRELCTDAAWIEHGKVLEQGAPPDVISAYLNEVREHRIGAEDALRSGRSELPDAELTQVRILDSSGQPAQAIKRGEGLTVEISYRANRPVATPVFGIALHRDDGVYVHGTNTHVDGLVVPPLEREGTLIFRYRSLPLLGGTYLLTVGLFGSNAQYAQPIDLHQQRYRFQVLPRTDVQGVVHAAHEWQVTGDQESHEQRVSTG
jgi:ABC-type polysaccharide/polyol phosphate transport system ATPase subunit